MSLGSRVAVAWEPSYAAGAALEKAKRQKKKKSKERKKKTRGKKKGEGGNKLH